MSTLKFKTNITCGGCIASVTPYLNEVKGLVKWEVDTKNLSRILTAEVDTATAEDVQQALTQAGYVGTLITE